MWFLVNDRRYGKKLPRYDKYLQHFDVYSTAQKELMVTKLFRINLKCFNVQKFF